LWIDLNETETEARTGTRTGTEAGTEAENANANADARGRIAILEEKANQHSHFMALLPNKVTQFSIDFGRLVREVSSLRSAAAGIRTLSENVSAQKTQIEDKLKDPIVEQLSTEFNELGKEVLTLKGQIAGMFPTVTPSQNELLPPSALVLSFDSRIISDFPEETVHVSGSEWSR
jgi:hypothetical protein